MRWALLLVAVTGCDKVLSLLPVPDAGRAIDAGDGGDSGGGTTIDGQLACTAPTLVTASAIGDTDPAQRGDERELFLARGTPGARDIASGTRAAGAEYVTLAARTDVNSGVDDYDPNPTDDGLTLYLISTRLNAVPHVFVATRASVTQPFAAPQVVSELQTMYLDHVATSPDGNTLYVTSGNNLYVTTRASATAAFSPPLAAGSGLYSPSVTANGLGIYYQPPVTAGVYVSTRATTAEMFAGGTMLLADGHDPSIAFHSHTIVFDRSDGLYTMTCF